MRNILSIIFQLTTNKKAVVFLLVVLTLIYFKFQSKPKLLPPNDNTKNKKKKNKENVKQKSKILSHKNDEILQMKTVITQQILSNVDEEIVIKQQMSNQQMDENEKKMKARERYEKKQKQRMKEKEETKQRRIQKEEEKKKKKKAILLKKKMAKRQEERLKKRDELKQKQLKNNSTESKQEYKQDKQNVSLIEIDEKDGENSDCDEKKENSEESEQEFDEINDMNISPKSLDNNNNYNKLRERFEMRYKHKNKLSQNENESENENKTESENENENENDDKEEKKQGEKEPKLISQKSKSLKIVNDEYKGNAEIMKLRSLYKKQHRMKQKSEKIKNKIAPLKPTNILKFLDTETEYILNELKQCICKNTHFQGLADFGSNNMGIELEITSNEDSNGYLTGKRIIPFRGNKIREINGKARIYFDVSWTGNKYVPCCKFEWIDEKNGIITKCEFDSAKNEIDLRHSFFNGKCMRYSNDRIIDEGYFDILCVSSRRREIKYNSFFNLYHTLNMNEMDENELEKVPKYLRRMKEYSDKINDQIYGDHNIGDSILDHIGE